MDRFLNGGDHAVAGPVRLLEHSSSLIPGAFDLDPAQVRAEIARRGWKTITGFQTRNLGHRAHERLQKTALEMTDGLLIHPLIGWKKPGDMLPEVILDGYSILIDRYYPKERVILAALTTAMRYAGPREAVFHALIRKNFGCTHFIVGPGPRGRRRLLREVRGAQDVRPLLRGRARDRAAPAARPVLVQRVPGGGHREDVPAWRGRLEGHQRHRSARDARTGRAPSRVLHAAARSRIS